MTLSPGQNVQPKRSMRISPGEFRAFCSSILSERAPKAAAVHRAENLDVAYRVKCEASRDAYPHNCEDLPHPLFSVHRIDEIEVSAFGRSEIGHQTLVDPVRIDDDPALSGLSKDLGQAHDRHRSRRDDVAENLPRPNRRLLIDIADEEQCRTL